MSWRITKWSKELGRGQIIGTVADPLDFDASIAYVDDFRIGEEVHVELERDGATWRVTKIWPDDPRFVLPVPVDEHTPALDRALEQSVQETLDRIHLKETYRLNSRDAGTLVLCGEEGYVYSAPSDEIILTGVRYLELANPLNVYSLRLASATERDYLGTRLEEFSSSDIALTLVDERRQFYFVVCDSLEYKQSS